VGTTTASLASRAPVGRVVPFALRGRVVVADDGFVTIRVQRSAGEGRGYRTVRTLRVRVSQAGTFEARVRLSGGGWRLEAVFAGSSTGLPSKSAFAYVRP
jgi:hypothetical protein